jgi:hypothetical protein
MSDVLSHHKDGDLEMESQLDHLKGGGVSMSHHVADKLSVLLLCSSFRIADRSLL